MCTFLQIELSQESVLLYQKKYVIVNTFDKKISWKTGLQESTLIDLLSASNISYSEACCGRAQDTADAGKV